MKRLAYGLTFLLAVALCRCGAGQEIRPERIARSAGPCFSFKNDPNDPQFAPQNCIDGDMRTYSCFMDDSPGGTDDSVNPPKGDAPVTGDVLFDLGGPRNVYGVKLVSPLENLYAPKRIDVFCFEPTTEPPKDCDAKKLEETPGVVFLRKNYEVPHLKNGQSHTLVFEANETRFIGIRVHEAHDSGRMGYYIFQLAEVVFYGVEAGQTINEDAILFDGLSYASLLDRDRETARRNVDPYTASRLRRDWMYQDCGLDVSACFTGSENKTETAMVRKVLDELTEYDVEIAEYEKRLQTLVDARTPGSDAAWSRLYFELCGLRRAERLAVLTEFDREYVFAKHYVLGGRGGTLAMTADLTDSEIGNRGPDWRVGSELCLLKIGDDGEPSLDVLLESKDGIIRDPDVSFDGDRIAFAMKTDERDDYHLYVMNPKDRSYRQITFGKATADVEPCFLPSGDLVFSSTRCDQSAPCWWSNVLNLYKCDAEGRFLRRLAFDSAHTFGPHVLDDGRVVYTRWEYNDRGPIFNQPLFVMNPDGTAQTEYYGNNSWNPPSVIHARGVPGTQKVIAVASGHHCDQTGALVLIDRAKGTQNAESLEFIPPNCPDVSVIDDRFGSRGALFQYPYALDEDNYLVSLLPEGGTNGRDRRYSTPFGIYWASRDGRRELLVYDPTISSGQIAPLAERDKTIVNASTVDLDKKDGTFFVQNVYVGPGLEGIPKGTIKKLRGVALESRAMGTTHSYNQYYGQVTTPVSICNGSWDVKHVLGTVDVEEDGSAFFTVPARTPVYFQLLDEKGYVVQTMRSWAMLQPGESFGCVGCHEDKNTNYFTESQKLSTAITKPPRKPTPFYPSGSEPIPERLAEMTPSEREAWEYLSVNAPQGMDRPRGFSYIREIQPIWDRHCVSCHTGRPDASGKTVPMSLLGDARTTTWEDIWRPEYTFPSTPQYLYTQNGKDTNAGRDFCESYLNLTNFGHKNELIDWLPAYSDPTMVKPYSFGAARSKLMEYLEPAHYGVELTREEKEKVACWIDLAVPFCGSYMEANHWDQTSYYMGRNQAKLRGVYLYHEQKRLRHAEIEVAHLKKYKEYLDGGSDVATDEFPVYDFGGIEEENEFIRRLHEASKSAPINGLAKEFTEEANPRRNLALNPDAATFSVRSWPHVASNSFYGYEDRFSPAAVVDGKTDGERFWRPNKRTDLWLKIEFGRTVSVDEIVLYKKTTGTERTGWTSATLVFSDGSREKIALQNTSEPQSFEFSARKCDSVALTELEQEFPLEENGIVELQVWGRDAAR